MTPQRAVPREGRLGAGEIRRALLQSQDLLAASERRATFETRLDGLMERGVAVRIALVAARRMTGAALDDDALDALDALVEQMEDRMLRMVSPEKSAGTTFGEFLIQLPEDGDRARMLLDALRREFTEPYELMGTLPGIEIHVTAAQSPEDGLLLETLLRTAGSALGGESLRPAIAVGWA